MGYMFQQGHQSSPSQNSQVLYSTLLLDAATPLASRFIKTELESSMICLPTPSLNFPTWQMGQEYSQVDVCALSLENHGVKGVQGLPRDVPHKAPRGEGRWCPRNGRAESQAATKSKIWFKSCILAQIFLQILQSTPSFMGVYCILKINLLTSSLRPSFPLSFPSFLPSLIVLGIKPRALLG